MEKREIRFDGWRVDFESGEISKDGNTHRLQDQPLQILDELTLRPGEVGLRDNPEARPIATAPLPNWIVAVSGSKA